jgi:F0F1-type ATP synthase epsilon subunit
MIKNKTLNVTVRDTENIIYKGEAERISSFNEVGRFDVYPQHANFISIIQEELQIFNNNQKVKELKIDQAVMKVKQDSVHIFLGLEQLFVEEKSDEHTEKSPLLKKH